MSNKVRNTLTVLMLVLLAASAFAAGYMANDLLALRNGSVHAREEFDLFWEAWGFVEKDFLGELPTNQTLTHAAIRGAITTLEDPYTVFVEPVARDREREALQGRFGGIGAYLSRPEDGGDVLLEPIPGNPAELAGILAGDVLLAVDGTAVTPDMTVNAVADLIRGEKGTTVVLTVRHPNAAAPVDVAVVRDDILLPSVSYRLLEDTTIGYIQLTRFSAESANEIAQALTALQEQGAAQLILDLRQNGGGLLDASVAVADHFLDGGPVLIQISRNQGERVFNATPKTLAPDAPLALLVDGGTASAAEILAGALQDRGRAVLIGAQTFGKGSVQLVYDLSDGSSVHVTSARWYTPERQALDAQGLAPDILVEITQEAIDNGRDEMLQRAIEYLQVQ
jgi:carboxyl-terminal processing protease